MRRKKHNKNLIVCPRSKQFTNLIVCAAGCDERCEIYRDSITLESLEKYVEEHPEYKIIGELMATKKAPVSKEKKFWVIQDDKSITEVTRTEIMDNPRDYLGKQIWEKPPYKYEVMISLKRIKA
ncbi:MAG: hypothetical protein H8E57_02690 [Candidatus Cloacimonetes bacterium]|nr:hypothetical protein [Candidatus Cloacimonadota bacterium]